MNKYHPPKSLDYDKEVNFHSIIIIICRGAGDFSPHYRPFRHAEFAWLGQTQGGYYAGMGEPDMPEQFHVIHTHLFGEEPRLMPDHDPNHVAWCRWVWNSLADGGAWGLPNSGLIFQKREADRELILTSAMPHIPEMPISADELLARQISLYIQTIEHFALCDVKVRRECSWPIPAKG